MIEINEELVKYGEYLTALETIECFNAQGDNKKLFTEIRNLDLPVRVINALWVIDVVTLFDVKILILKHGIEHLISIRGIGKKYSNKLAEMLEYKK